jgi:hypothetical protein
MSHSKLHDGRAAWGVQLRAGRDNLLKKLFMDLEDPFEERDLASNNVLSGACPSQARVWTPSTIKSWRPSCSIGESTSMRISSDEHEDIAPCDQVALPHITSAPLDDGPSDEGVIVSMLDTYMLHTHG